VRTEEAEATGIDSPTNSGDPAYAPRLAAPNAAILAKTPTRNFFMFNFSIKLKIGLGCAD